MADAFFNEFRNGCQGNYTHAAFDLDTTAQKMMLWDEETLALNLATQVDLADIVAGSVGTNRIGSEPAPWQDFSVDVAGNIQPTTGVGIGAFQLLTYSFDGVVSDSVGNIIYNTNIQTTNLYTVAYATTSDGSDNYTVTVLDNVSTYALYVTTAGPPHRYGGSDNNLSAS